MCSLLVLKVANIKNVTMDKATEAICVCQSWKQSTICEEKGVSFPKFYFYSYQIICCTVVGDIVWYPDGLEICGKDIRVNVPWVVTHADPPIDSDVTCYLLTARSPLGYPNSAPPSPLAHPGSLRGRCTSTVPPLLRALMRCIPIQYLIKQ